MSNDAFREFLKRDKILRRQQLPSSQFIPAVVQLPPTTSQRKISQLRETVDDPSACFIEIRNGLPTALIEPKYYCCYGSCHNPLGDIQMGASEVFAFTNSSPLVSGVFSYRIWDKYLFVLHSTYDKNNFVILYITSKELPIGVELFVRMIKDRDNNSNPDSQKLFGWARKGNIKIRHGNVLVRAHMSEDVKSVLEIDISSAIE